MPTNSQLRWYATILVSDKLFSGILDKFVPECFYRGSIQAQALDESIRAQAFLAEFEITNIKF